jgi:two-component system CheB/CheR fusion protein
MVKKTPKVTPIPKGQRPAGKKKTSDKRIVAGSADNTSVDALDIDAGPTLVVALGASAGGLEALIKFFEAVPDDTGMAFVVVHHVDPNHESLMAEILAKHTKMTVEQAKDKTVVQPDSIYTIQPDRFLKIVNGSLRLSKPEAPRGLRLPIDFFFRSLAEDQNEKAVGIILSGTGSDGTQGMKAIKENGGMVMVQDPQEASQVGMPRSAIATEIIDHILSVTAMPETLIGYAKHPYVKNSKDAKVLGDRARGSLTEIISVLKAHSPINFTLYKEGTMLRRIERRMGLRHIENATDYVALLKDNPDEAENLCADLLISVTSFFRDSESFDYLTEQVLKDLVKQRDSDTPIRVWVPACATGEEAYSLAMLIIEQISALRKNIKLQIFASDFDERALEIARAGVYPDSIEADVNPTRLRRFFEKEDHTYRVTTELRETVIFAKHNLLSDAPFSKLDLVSCRNLLIYLNADAQERSLSMFHFGLNVGGHLFLGSSETIGKHEETFQAESTKHRIFKRIGVSRYRRIDFPITPSRLAPSVGSSLGSTNLSDGSRLEDLSQKLLVERYAPAAILINTKMEALYIEGATDKYLMVPRGAASQDLVAMTRDGLRAKLSIAIRKAIQDETDVSKRASVTHKGDTVAVEIGVHPLLVDEERLFLVTFSDLPSSEEAQTNSNGHKNQSTHKLLEKELESTKHDLRATIHDLEHANEELKASNEEAMSMNEEFQSTNEELETSKEELQSLNEELTTLNAQLQQKIDSESHLVDDLNNLLSSSGIATLFLDRNFNIMRFTPTVRNLFNVISSDVGRPFADITSKIDDPELLHDAEKVLANLTRVIREVRAMNGEWFNRAIHPYRTKSEKIDGVVVTYSNITLQKKSESAAAASTMFAENIINTVREPLIVLDENLHVVQSSKSFDRKFGTQSKNLKGQSFYKLSDGQWDVLELRDLLGCVLPEKTNVESFEITIDLREEGKRQMVLNARAIQKDGGSSNLILLAIEDITENKIAQDKLLDRQARLSAILETAPDAIITCDERGTVSSFSPAAEHVFGYAASEVIGKNVKMLMAEPYRHEHDGYISHYMETGEKKIIGIGREVTGQRKDKSHVPIRLSVSELWIGERRLFTGILHDLTLEKKRREELRRVQKMEAIGQLTGGIAHDFNNLLTVVIGNLELLQQNPAVESDVESVTMALEAAELGAQLTKQLLAFAKRQPLSPKSVSLNKLVQSMQPLLTRSIGEKITIEIELDDSLNSTMADPGQIENSLLNMALNARDAMPDGGTLLIKTSNVILDEDYVATQVDLEPGPYVLISVTDTGCGMEPDVIERAFEPFFTTKGTGEGTGLGLSMIYGFAKQSNGHLAVFSEVGQGTTINLYLPPVEKPEEHSSATKQDKSRKPKGETVLVVEDDPRVRKLTVTRLETLGYKVVSAQDGPEAINIVKSNKSLDLVLSDVVMPGGMSGFEVAEQTLLLNPKLKVLLATGYAEGAEAGSKTKPAEAYRTLRKPYRITDLATALRDLLD